MRTYKEDENSITPNSMSPLPTKKFINYARTINDDKNESNEPNKTIYGFKKWERSQKQKKQQDDYNKWYDYFNH